MIEESKQSASVELINFRLASYGYTLLNINDL